MTRRDWLSESRLDDMLSAPCAAHVPVLVRAVRRWQDLSMQLRLCLLGLDGEERATEQERIAAARAGRIPARRVPGGRWWLFDPETLRAYRRVR